MLKYPVYTVMHASERCLMRMHAEGNVIGLPLFSRPEFARMSVGDDWEVHALQDRGELVAFLEREGAAYTDVLLNPLPNGKTTCVAMKVFLESVKSGGK
jgi:hypothetical protein